MTTDYEKLGVFYLGREYDPAKAQLTATPILYDSRDLTTHAVCLGMTGSGKTGLCVALLEEAAIDGIPAICIDPKGDIANLALTFPNLTSEDFAEWVDPGEAARKGLTVAQLGAQTAESWKAGLAEWDEPPERVGRFRNAAEVTIYTPGAGTGVPLSVLRSLSCPSSEVLADTPSLRDQIASTVSAILALLDRDADPVKSRDHILLSRILDQCWNAGTSLDLVSLIGAIQKPGFDKLGAFDLETFYPARERVQLAMAVNSLLASPGFAAWMEGEPLDAQRLLFTPEGRPRIAVISIAHLSDTERMFIVTLVLNELVAWMRRQGGTSSLRALFYMDEIFGFFPPTANPPSKQPMLTLLKQARAFGLGCVLATQNPIDLDYRGLGNTGTWLIGRLQTERDRMRVIDGLTSAVGSGATPERGELEKLMSSLAPRIFLMRNARDDTPRLMKSRWALSFLRGPLTGIEITRLMADRRKLSAAAAGPGRGAMSPSATASAPATSTRPPLPPQIRELFLPALNGSGAIEYRPMILGAAKMHYVDAKSGVDLWQTAQYLAPLSDDARDAQWEQSRDVSALRTQAAAAPAAGATFGPLPGPVTRADSYASWGKALSAWLYQSARTDLLSCDALKLMSNPGESEGDFRTRLSLKLREQSDAEKEALRRAYAPKLAALQGRLVKAQARVDREKSQRTQQALQTAVSVGATILGAFLGRKAVSASNIGRATTAVRSAARIGRENQDVALADESAAAVAQMIQELKDQCDCDLAALTAKLDPARITLRAVQVSPRKSDTAIGELALAWVPWRTASDGFPAPAC